MLSKRFLSLLFSCTCILKIHASEIAFSIFSVEDGLSHETVRDIAQDNDGFLWFVTDDGLNRFDGFSFVEVDISLPSKESNIIVSDVEIDNNGNIWLATLGHGVIKYNPSTKEFISVAREELNSDLVKEIFIDSKNNIWVGTLENGLNQLKESGEHYEVIDFSSEISGITSPSITSFVEDNLGRIWIGTDGDGIHLFNPNTRTWLNLFEHFSPTFESIDRKIKTLFKDSSGNIWIGTDRNGAIKYTIKGNMFTQLNSESQAPLQLPNNRVLTIFEDNSNNIWLGTDGGIAIYNDGIYQTLSSDINSPNSLSNDRVLSIFQDRGGLIWIGSYSGVNKWNPKTRVFNHILPKLSESLNHSVITDFGEDRQGKVYVSTYGGGVIYTSNIRTEEWIYFSNEQGLVENRIMSLTIDNEDNIWVGTRSRGLIKYSKNLEKLAHFESNNTNNSKILSNGVTDVLQDSAGRMWVATYNGGVTLLSGEEAIHFQKGLENQRSLSSQNIFQIVEDQDGIIWLASDNGINRIDPLTHQAAYVTESDSLKGLTSSLTWQIFEDSKGNFWISTQGNGLYYWSYEDRVKLNENFVNLTEEEGLPSNTVYDFLQDDSGYVWASTARGLTKISPTDFSIENYNKDHGLQGYDFNLGASFKDSEGALYFGGNNGFNRFIPDQLSSNQVQPSVSLIQVEVIGKPINIHNNGAPYEFDHNDYLISFDYVALDFAAPEKNQYKYRLTGFDNDWIDVGNRRRATYTNLPAGTYEFQVMAANNDGVWSNPQINLPVVVKPAPWKTPLAYSIYAFLVGSIIVLFLRNQMQRLAFEERQRKKLEKQVSERTQELAKQNNKLQKLNAELDHAYRTDALTGIKNRRFLESYLQETLPTLVPFNPEKPQYMLVLLLDIDNLKPINDAYGHAAGDATISHAASLLGAIMPEDYHLIRWGGDEFLLLGITSDKASAQVLVERLIGTINSEQFLYLDKPIALSCSAGFAHYPFEETCSKAISWDQVTMLADKAMNSAKHDENTAWIGVTKAKREVNDLYVSDLMHCSKITDATELVDIVKGA